MQKRFKYLFFPLALAVMACGGISAEKKDIEIITSKLLEMLPEEVEIVSIEEVDINGFYEVNFKGIEPLYVTSDGNYLISGDIYSITRDGLINKSEARRDYQRKAAMSQLDREELIIFEPEDLKFNIYVFTDVDCGYCRQFHNQIDEYLELGIRVHYLAYPRAGVGSESFKKISSAWCDNDPNYSLTLLKQGKDIQTKLCSKSPVERHFKLGNAMGVQGTPSIITDDGKMIPGYLPPQDLLNILES